MTSHRKAIDAGGNAAQDYAMEERVAKLEQTQETIRSELRAFSSEIKTEMAGFRVEIAGIRAEIAGVRTEIEKSANATIRYFHDSLQAQTRWFIATMLLIVGLGISAGIFKFNQVLPAPPVQPAPAKVGP